ncbi:MAG: Permease of the drug/metabolite transporter (DMT) superfamily [Cytophagales bacterium]|jgi:drug/metabolite transporter (DMT)-like permease|nr:DMT family transporter [Bacteroidota bacterium]MBS1980597.1 DMT family transporter [Bacteroidota bacterium]WHZ07919.1 MAG: Permease of the drug/metabolite transporter (DMT) superfamily [Cytophagales bacterium]
MPEKNRFAAVVLLLTLSVIWGTSFILIKQGLKVFSPDEVGALRVATAFLFLMPVSLQRVKEIQRPDYWKIFLSGMLAVFIPAFLFASAQTHLNSSLAGILNTQSPIWTMIIGAAFFSQRFRGWAIFGAIISLAGCIVLAMARPGSVWGGFNSWSLLIVLACACYGLNLNFIKFKVTGVDPMTLISVSLLFIAPLAYIYLFGFTEVVNKLSSTPGAWSAFGFVAILALMSTAVANLLFYKLLRISSPFFTSSVTYVMPIVSVMWGVIDGEVLLLGHLTGMVLILGGVFLANQK